MKITIARFRINYHLDKTNKALFRGDKRKFKKHATMVHKLLWKAVHGSK